MMQGDDEAYWLSMPGVYGWTWGLVRVLDSGDMEFEVCDGSAATRTIFGAPVSTIYTLNKTDVPRLAQRLALGFGGSVPSVGKLPEQLTTFMGVEALIEWLREDAQLPLKKRIKHHNPT